jgi:predicted GTPase
MEPKFSDDIFKKSQGIFSEELSKAARKLIENAPRILVMGENGSGKSTLINEFFGCELLKKAVVNIYLYDKYDSETARLATENPVR